ncbi:hypothetical protein Q9233_000497 [Columba guinea]|nr:hypothetical protein Q9233_000497 [Columba guinea]
MMSSRSSGVALGLGSQPSCSNSVIAQRNSVPALNVRVSRSRSLTLLSRQGFGKGFRGSFCNVSDALGADLLERSGSIPDPQLVRRIVSQVEFYLSDENLAKDAFLLKHVQKNKMGFVRIKLLTSFKKVKYLTCDWRLTLYALRFSELLEDTLSPLQKNFLETITRMFSPFGTIASLRILRPGRKLPSGVRKYASRFPELLSRCCALVEYESLESARRALEELGHPGGRSIRVVPLSGKGSKKKPEAVEEPVDHLGLKAQATDATFPYGLGGSLLGSTRELNGASALPSLLLNKEPSEPTWPSSDFNGSNWSDTFTGSLLSSDLFPPFDANVGTGSCSSPESPCGAWGSGAPAWASSSSWDPKPRPGIPPATTGVSEVLGLCDGVLRLPRSHNGTGGFSGSFGRGELVLQH